MESSNIKEAGEKGAMGAMEKSRCSQVPCCDSTASQWRSTAAGLDTSVRA